GDFDICLVKFNELGIAQWYKTKGGSQQDIGAGAALDSQDNVYVVGSLWASANNYNTVLLKYAIDTLVPIVVINSPRESATYGTNAPNYDITVIEKNLDETWYSLDNGETNTSFTDLTGAINQVVWDDIPWGAVNLTFYARDTSGNVGFQQITIYKDIRTNPEVIHSFNLWIITTTSLIILGLIIITNTSRRIKAHKTDNLEPN
ncbi:MAG: hypothetical protein ACFFBE_16095, partial [Promethearchaeota archaeon]